MIKTSARIVGKSGKAHVTAISFALALLVCTFAFIGADAQTPPATAPAPQTPPAAVPAPAAATPAPTAPSGAVVGGFNFKNGAPLLDVIDLIANELKLTYVLDPSIPKTATVILNTYGVVRDLDLRQLLETILRMNNLAMVQVGDMYRIVPVANVSRLPIQPVMQSDSSKFSEDDHMVLNLVFLHYMTSSEMQRILDPFRGEGAQITSYDPANLLIILDNSRNMRRTLDLINMFDSDTFAGQRVRAFEVKNGRPSDIKKELDDVFKAYSLSTGTKGGGSVQFMALDRINTIVAVAPNPGVFTEVESWLAKLDIAPKVTAGSVANYVYKLKYGRAEILGSVVGSLYGIPVSNLFGTGAGGLYGGMPGYSGYPAQSGLGGMGGGGLGGGGFGGGGLGASPYGYGNGAQQYSGAYNQQYSGQQQQQYAPATPFTPSAAPAGAAGATGTTGTPADQTGTYLGSTGGGTVQGRPRIVPNPIDNTILVQSTPDQWDQIHSLLDQIDQAPRQVLIDAKIYEVTLNGSLSAGVEAYLQKRGAANSAVSGQHQLTGSLANTAGGVLGLTLSAGTMVGQARELLASLQANELRSNTKILSAPSVIATDSIPASITVGDSVPTLSSQGVNPGVTSGGNSLFTNTISNVSTGVGLNILARVNPSGVVTMVIDQSVTSPTTTTSSTIDSPSFSQRNVSTQVTVDDGDTIAIGGIIDETTTESDSGIPFLDRIPGLGFLFGSKSWTKARTELIIFLTPRVIYDTHHISDATQELKDKVKDLRKEIEKKNP